ncbi:hypothetical protein B0A49_09530 [Cryomyces minteri]|uniref:Uncharacterized protein n=1 Tax=Cryomyces minteri TaxID=331657 RepID=A0A4U0WWH1_9PEZI|nr:hypothetical protein B0A49_09530 [Cryomyces minteri]
MFSQRHSWFGREIQAHWKQLCCTICQHFSSELANAFKTHLRHHLGSFTEVQLPALVKAVFPRPGLAIPRSCTLQAASFQGNEKIVQMLLEKGADINAYGGGYGSALQAASERGHEEIVMLLLDKGADVDTQGAKHSSAIDADLGGGRKGVATLLRLSKTFKYGARQDDRGTESSSVGENAADGWRKGTAACGGVT